MEDEPTIQAEVAAEVATVDDIGGGESLWKTVWVRTPWPVQRYNILALTRTVVTLMLVGATIYCNMNAVDSKGLDQLTMAAVTFYFLERKTGTQT